MLVHKHYPTQSFHSSVGPIVLMTLDTMVSTTTENLEAPTKDKARAQASKGTLLSRSG